MLTHTNEKLYLSPGMHNVLGQNHFGCTLRANGGHVRLYSQKSWQGSLLIIGVEENKESVILSVKDGLVANQEEYIVNPGTEIVIRFSDINYDVLAILPLLKVIEKDFVVSELVVEPSIVVDELTVVEDKEEPITVEEVNVAETVVNQIEAEVKPEPKKAGRKAKATVHE